MIGRRAKRLPIFITANMEEKKLDILIPCAQRHIRVLPECIKGVKENIVNAGDVYVALESGDILVDPEHIGGATLIPEDDIACVTSSEIEAYWKDNSPMEPRVGWLKQQIIKMRAYRLGMLSNDFITVDADHYLLKPHRFTEDGKYVYYTRNFYMYWFEIMVPVLLKDAEKYRPNIRWSPVTEKMVFNKALLQEVTETVEAVQGKPLWQAAIDCCKGNGKMMFSEFTLYNVYVLKNYPDLLTEKKEALGVSHMLPDGEMAYETVKGNFDGFESVSFF